MCGTYYRQKKTGRRPKAFRSGVDSKKTFRQRRPPLLGGTSRTPTRIPKESRIAKIECTQKEDDNAPSKVEAKRSAHITTTCPLFLAATFRRRRKARDSRGAPRMDEPSRGRSSPGRAGTTVRIRDAFFQFWIRCGTQQFLWSINSL